MTGWRLAGRVLAAYMVGFVLFLCLRHWQAEVPWSEAALDALVFAFVSTVVGLVLRRVLTARPALTDRRAGDGRPGGR